MTYQNSKIKVGLLGGSFNPAHEGHLHISCAALKLLGLDEIWWLVTPQNPLKPEKDMESLQKRLKKAQNIARTSKKIKVSAIEKELGTIYTVDSLAQLKTLYPKINFIWLMGADNLLQIPQWKCWEDIFHSVPIAVFDRAPYNYKALSGKAAIKFASAKKTVGEARNLVKKIAPAWVFLRIPGHPASSSEIRKEKKLK